MRVVQGLLELAERSGAARQAIFQELGFDLDRYAQDDAIPRSTLYRICELVIEHTHEPALGLRWAPRQKPATFSPVSYLVTHAPTLRLALDALLQLQPLFSEHPSFRIFETEHTVTLQCHRLSGASPTVQRFLAEMMVAGLHWLTLCFEPRAAMRLVSFEHREPLHREDYEQVFRSSICFDQPFSGLVIDSALLDASSRHSDADMFELLSAVAKRRMSRRSLREPLWQRVRGLLMQRPNAGSLRMSYVARACGISLRTLRRHLAAEGKSYQEVVDDALSSVAKELLSDERSTLEQVSTMLGFSCLPSFHRAFKRWTGLTPRAFRLQHASPDSAQGAPFDEDETVAHNSIVKPERRAHRATGSPPGNVAPGSS